MPELLSHDELMDALHDRGLSISPYTLEHYRRQGVLPRPIRRQHDGAVRPVYPDWYVPLIGHIKQLQAEGASLEEIREALRPFMPVWAVSSFTWRHTPQLKAATAALDVALSAYVKAWQEATSTPQPIMGVRVSLLGEEGADIHRYVISYVPD